MDTRDKINSFEDAMVLTNSKPVPAFTNIPKNERDYYKALYMLKTITKAYNEGWELNWEDNTEAKYAIWFAVSSSGFMSLGVYYVYSGIFTGCGSCLCYKTKADAEDSARKFSDLWKIIQLH